jgi:hypothetical protein
MSPCLQDRPRVGTTACIFIYVELARLAVEVPEKEDKRGQRKEKIEKTYVQGRHGTFCCLLEIETHISENLVMTDRGMDRSISGQGQTQ